MTYSIVVHKFSTMPQLTNLQRDELISQYAELVVDRMDLECLMQIAEDHITDYCDSLSDAELKEEIDNEDDGLFDELADNVSNVTLLDPKDYSWGKETVD